MATNSVTLTFACLPEFRDAIIGLAAQDRTNLSKTIRELVFRGCAFRLQNLLTQFQDKKTAVTAMTNPEDRERGTAELHAFDTMIGNMLRVCKQMEESLDIELPVQTDLAMQKAYALLGWDVPEIVKGKK